MILQFTIEHMPPPINACRMAMRGRIIDTAEYRNWKDPARMMLEVQCGKLPDPCFWRIDIQIPAKYKRADVDAYNKQIIDVIVKAGKAPDDRWLVDQRTRYYPSDIAKITIKNEEKTKWAIILKASKYTMKQLDKAIR